MNLSCNKENILISEKKSENDKILNNLLFQNYIIFDLFTCQIYKKKRKDIMIEIANVIIKQNSKWLFTLFGIKKNCRYGWVDVCITLHT